MCVVSLVSIVACVLVTDGLAGRQGRVAAEARFGGVGNGDGELAGVNIACIVGGVPGNGCYTDVELLTVERVACAAVLNGSAGKFPGHCRVNAAIVVGLGIPAGSVVSVISLICIVACVLVTDGLAGRQVRVAAEARFGGVSDGDGELAGVNVACIVGGVPGNSGDTDVELNAVERVVTIVGCGTSKFPAHIRIKTAVVVGLGIPAGSVMSMVSLVGIVACVLVTDGFAGRQARVAAEAGFCSVGYGHGELAGVNVANGICSIPSYSSGTDVELNAVECVGTIAGCFTG